MFKKREEQKPNISVCSLLDANAETRTFFDVEADWDGKFRVLYFLMYDIKDKKKKRMSDIVVSYDKRKDDLNDLIRFLKDWKFSATKYGIGYAPRFWLDCDCLSDTFRFTKIKKELYNDKEDNVYIDFFSSGGNFKRKQVVEVNITKDQAKILVEQLENFLTKSPIKMEETNGKEN